MTASSPLVLVVEDEPVLRGYVLRLLESQGYRTIGVSSVAAALDVVRATPPDSVLCDYHLPDGSGLDVLRSLQAHADTRTTPFTISTADIGLPDEVMEECRRLGALVLIGVPSRSEILSAILEMGRQG